MAKTKRTVAVDATLDDAELAMHRYANAAHRKDEILAKIEQQRVAAQAKYDDELKDLDATMTESTDVLEGFALQNKDEWGGKSLELNHGVIGFNTSPHAVVPLKKTPWTTIVDFLKSMKLKQFIRISEEVNKEEILKFKDDAKMMAKLEQAKISVTQKENFYVKTI